MTASEKTADAQGSHQPDADRHNLDAHTPEPWHYVYGALWTTPDGPEDGGACIATRASEAPIAPHVRDNNLRRAAACVTALAGINPAAVPDVLGIVREVLRVAEESPDAATLSACIADGIPVYRAAIAKAEERA